MANIEKSEIELAEEREEDRRAEIAAAVEMENRREHEYRIAKLKYSVQPRYKSIERAIATIAKMPTLPVAVACVTVLTLKGREVPDTLVKFLTI